MHVRLLAILAFFSVAASPSVTSAQPSSIPVGLALSAAPQVVDVGSEATFTLRARKWNGPASVTLTFLSPHHGFTGAMPWRPSCGCYQLNVILARRIHALETGRALVRIRAGNQSLTTSTAFQIRGLSNNGRDFAPGGQVVLLAWVSDPHPSKNQYQHYCAFIKTADGLGVPGYRVSFVAHFPAGTQTYLAGLTDRNGVACTSKSVGNIATGTKVVIQVYAGGLRAEMHFSSQN